jgi:hypothetical protein
MHKKTKPVKGAFQIEFTGPIGAGKSYCHQIVLDIIKLRYSFYRVAENNCDSTGVVPDIISNISLQNWKTDIFLMPWCLLFIVRNPSFFLLCLRLILKIPEPFSVRLALLRSYWRKSGIQQYFRSRKFTGSVALIDEGIFHFSHNVLMAYSYIASHKDIENFAKWVPKSNLILLITAPVETLRERLDERGQITSRARDPGNHGPFLQNAAELFDIISKGLYHEKNVLIINNDGCFPKDKLSILLQKFLPQNEQE